MYTFEKINKLASKKDLSTLWVELQRYCSDVIRTDIIIDWIHEKTIKRLILSDCSVELHYKDWIVKEIDIIK